jgi:hypothetical protein
MAGLVYQKTLLEGTSVTATTTETITYSVLIPANTFTFNEGGIIDLNVRIQKNNTTNSYTMRVYENTTSSLAGAQQIMGNIGSASTAQYYFFMRTFSISRNTLTFMNVTSQNQDNRQESTAGVIGNSTFDCSVDNYIIVSLQLSASTGGTIIKGSFLNLVCYN